MTSMKQENAVVVSPWSKILEDTHERCEFPLSILYEFTLGILCEFPLSILCEFPRYIM